MKSSNVLINAFTLFAKCKEIRERVHFQKVLVALMWKEHSSMIVNDIKCYYLILIYSNLHTFEGACTLVQSIQISGHPRLDLNYLGRFVTKNFFEPPNIRDVLIKLYLLYVLVYLFIVWRPKSHIAKEVNFGLAQFAKRPQLYQPFYKRTANYRHFKIKTQWSSCNCLLFEHQKLKYCTK